MKIKPIIQPVLSQMNFNKIKVYTVPYYEWERYMLKGGRPIPAKLWLNNNWKYTSDTFPTHPTHPFTGLSNILYNLSLIS